MAANTPSKDRILVIDDDEDLTEMIRDFLLSSGFEVQTVANGNEAVERIVSDQPNLVVLDLMLPGIDGLSVCRQVRPSYSGPILMLTALADDIDEVTGLEVGADDYLAKPVRPRVLLARIRALLRRVEQTPVAAVEDAPLRTLQIGALAIDRGAREVRMADRLVDLTAAEFELLWLLASQAGHVVSREHLHDQTLHTVYDGLDRTIDLRVSRLRRKIGDDPRQPSVIKTVRGRGYLLVER
ncbi:MAG: DNA-binding response regulator [Lysobacteraceae bacterium]|nr:MAG: DNA-binding response regulator [Xanthomonadaceae bacterium]